MKKNLHHSLLLIAVCVFTNTSSLFAQVTLPNDSFEQWDSSGNPPPFDWHQPSDWSSTNPVTEFISAGITKSTDAHSGNFAAQIKTLNIFGTYRAGGLVCGHAKNVTSPDYTILPVTGGQPVSNKPVKVRGWYKFSTTTSSDSACVIVINKKWNTGSSDYDTIGLSRTYLPPASTYTLFEAWITDWDNFNSPDSVAVAFFSSNPDTASAGGILLVDDVELDFTTSISENEISMNEFQLYPNPASDELNIFFNKNSFFTSLNIYSSIGKIISSEKISGDSNFTIDVHSLPAGLYLIEMKNDTGLSVQKKFLKVD